MSSFDSEPTTTPPPQPKLSLCSLPSKKPPDDPPGMLTPPLQTQTLVSIPFDWEEAPGKPKAAVITAAAATTTTTKPKAARCLELPPRLLNEVKFPNTPSPTTVLDGPYMGGGGGRSGRSLLSSTLSFRKIGASSFRIHDTSSGSFRKNENCNKGRSAHLGYSWRWGDLKENKEVNEGSFDFLSLGDGGNGKEEVVVEDKVGGGGAGGGTKVKITSARRKGSFFSHATHKKSHLWASIYESFKQVVPWRRKQQIKIEKNGIDIEVM